MRSVWVSCISSGSAIGSDWATVGRSICLGPDRGVWVDLPRDKNGKFEKKTWSKKSEKNAAH